MDYLPRIVDSELSSSLKTFGAVLIEGPKWCGKTTTASQAASSSLSLTNPAGNFAQRQLAEIDPSAALEGTTPRLLDEWQEVPKLWDAVRYTCDKRAATGQFILTGSATPKDGAQPMHSGVGRFGRIRMGTMSLQELQISTGSVSLAGLMAGESYRAVGKLDMQTIAELIVRGGWPGAVNLSTPQASDLARAYVEGVCVSDVSRVDGVRRDPDKVRALIASLSRNESTLASQKAIVADMGSTASRQTVATYASILSRLNFIEDIPAWSPAMRSPVPLRSAKKHHLCDPSVAAAALGADVQTLVDDPKTLGLLFESLAIHDLIVYAQAMGAHVYHYHDASDLEVDAIVAKPGGSWAAFEIKLGSGGVEAGGQNLLSLERKMIAAGNREPAAKCVIVGFGVPAYTTDDGVQVVPLDTLGV